MATSLTQNFSKEEFKKNVISNCKSLYRKNIEEANDQEVFQAVSYAVKDIIIDKWIATHKQYEKDDPKMVYYMSMEFLMGRALGNNMINLCAYDEINLIHNLETSVLTHSLNLRDNLSYETFLDKLWSKVRIKNNCDTLVAACNKSFLLSHLDKNIVLRKFDSLTFNI